MALCLHEGSVDFHRNDKLCVRNIDRWTFELAVLQGQRGIALLLSRAAVSEPSALSLFHHILHINKTAGEQHRGDKEKRNQEMRRRRRSERGETN